jgi:hypothetical protein
MTQERQALFSVLTPFEGARQDGQWSRGEPQGSAAGQEEVIEGNSYSILSSLVLLSMLPHRSLSLSLSRSLNQDYQIYRSGASSFTL